MLLKKEIIDDNKKLREEIGKLVDELEEQERHIKEADAEIERLKEINKELGRDYSSANNGFLRLHSIIKEVREYIELGLADEEEAEELLKILDKGEQNEKMEI